MKRAHKDQISILCFLCLFVAKVFCALLGALRGWGDGDEVFGEAAAVLVQ
jgi:hypothetical protein